MINLIIFSIIHYLINFLLNKTSFLIDQKKTSAHKKKIKTSKKTPLASGLVFLICFTFILEGQNYLLFIDIPKCTFILFIKNSILCSPEQLLVYRFKAKTSFIK